MGNLDLLFRKRIGVPENKDIVFDMLEDVLEKTARTIPFENVCIMENQTYEITKENLIDKVLVKNQGGLCYELNSIFYLFLIENGFNAALVRGAVYNDDRQAYQKHGRTHVAILLYHQEKAYLIDTGFGGNLPLKPVHLTGETVISKSGEFRIRKVESEQGDYALEMKLKHKSSEWKIGYAFDSTKPVIDLSELNEIQTFISEDPASPFNKSTLMTRFTDNGNIILTNSSFTQWADGMMTKEKIDTLKFKEMSKHYFGM